MRMKKEPQMNTDKLSVFIDVHLWFNLQKFQDKSSAEYIAAINLVLPILNAAAGKSQQLFGHSQQ
jgi:hypothetical protein